MAFRVGAAGDFGITFPRGQAKTSDGGGCSAARKTEEGKKERKQKKGIKD